MQFFENFQPEGSLFSPIDQQQTFMFNSEEANNQCGDYVEGEDSEQNLQQQQQNEPQQQQSVQNIQFQIENMNKDNLFCPNFSLGSEKSLKQGKLAQKQFQKQSIQIQQNQMQYFYPQNNNNNYGEQNDQQNNNDDDEDDNQEYAQNIFETNNKRKFNEIMDGKKYAKQSAKNVNNNNQYQTTADVTTRFSTQQITNNEIQLDQEQICKKQKIQKNLFDEEIMEQQQQQQQQEEQINIFKMNGDFENLPVCNSEEKVVFQFDLTEKEQQQQKNEKVTVFQSFDYQDLLTNIAPNTNNYLQQQQQQSDKFVFQTKNSVKGVLLKFMPHQIAYISSQKWSYINAKEYLAYLKSFELSNNTFDLQVIMQQYELYDIANLQEIYMAKMNRKNLNKPLKVKEERTLLEKKLEQVQKITKSYNCEVTFEIENLVKNQKLVARLNEEIQKINIYNLYNRNSMLKFLRYNYPNIIYNSSKIKDKESYNFYSLLIQESKLLDTDEFSYVK